ncbi:hypothetical protein MTO96_042076 [Rhipicephalus appendiculatus]
MLKRGEVVRIRDKAWTHKAQIIEPVAPRSYRVVTEEDKVNRRNRRHLIPTRERFRHDGLDSDEPDTEDDQPEAIAPTEMHANPPPPPTRLPRRSRRATRQPRRLQYDHNFNQVHSVSRL